MLINLGSIGFMRVLSVVLSALVYFIIAYFAMKLITSALKKILDKFKVEDIVAKFIISLVKVALWVVTILITLSAIGFDISSLITVLATCGVAIALALKDSLGNIAGGILVITSKNFDKGDFIEVAGKAGVVQEVGLLYTTILTPDNQTVTIPNGALTTNSVSNYSREGTRRVDMDFGIAYKSDIAKACLMDRSGISRAFKDFEEKSGMTIDGFIDMYDLNAEIYLTKVLDKIYDAKYPQE